MNDRIALVLRAKNITPSQLADDLGVQRSGVSHILNNRNKPSLEFIQKVLKCYPEISTEWMLFGEGQMMKPFLGEEPKIAPVQDTAQKPLSPKPIIMDLFAEDDTGEDVQAIEIEESELEEADEVSDRQYVEDLNSLFETQPEISSEKADTPYGTDSPKFTDEPKPKEEPLNINREKLVDIKKPVTSKDDRQIEKIVIFYSDKTFSSYTPEKDG